MQAHKMRVVVPEDHRALIEFPESIRSGPVELIVLVPPEDTPRTQPAAAPPPARGRLKALAAELRRDPRPFRNLSAEERGARLERVMGIGRGLMSTSEEFARSKREEAALEEGKLTS